MRAKAFVLSAMSALVLIGGVTLSSTRVLAQQNENDPSSQANTPEEEVTVVAPRVIRTKVRGTVPGGVGYYDMLTLTHQVSYADLNLAHPGDAKTFKDRIAKAANEICEQLANVAPPESKSQDCVHEAIRSAMPQADAVIAAAKQQ